MQLTRNFSYEKFFVSSDFPELAKEALNHAPETAKETFYLLCRDILQPTRDAIKHVMIITSGGRTRRLVKAIYLKLGELAPKKSLHEYYIAADFTAGDKTREGFEYIRDNLGDRYGQLIYYKKKNMVHVSLPTKWYDGKNKLTREK